MNTISSLGLEYYNSIYWDLDLISFYHVLLFNNFLRNYENQMCVFWNFFSHSQHNKYFLIQNLHLRIFKLRRFKAINNLVCMEKN